MTKRVNHPQRPPVPAAKQPNAGRKTASPAKDAKLLSLQQQLEQQQLAEHTRQSEELHRVNRTLRTLRGGNRALLAARTELGLFEAICNVIVERSGFLTAWVGYALHDVHKTFQVVAAAGAGTDSIKACPIRWDESSCGTGPSGAAVRSGRPVLKQDLATDSSVAVWQKDLAREGFAAALGLPLFLNGEVFGALVVIAGDPHAFDGESLALFEEMAADVSFGVAVLRDREEQRLKDTRIHWLAYHDAETSLPNRRSFLEFLDAHLQKFHEDHQPLAVITLYAQETSTMSDVLFARDLCRVLLEVSRRIRPHLDDSAYWGLCAEGRFALAMPGCNLQDALVMADTIQIALQKPVAVGKVQIDITPVIGIAIFPGHAQSGEELLRNAEVALRVARRNGTICEVFRATFEQESRNNLRIAGGIRTGLKKHEFVLYYQPKIDLRNGDVLGAEALVRWIHPAHGIVSPADFIPVAEKTGLIKPLTDWVVQEAMRQAFKLLKGANREHRISINMCARSFFDPGLRQQLGRALETWGVSPEDIVLELTESMLAENVRGAVQILHSLREMGLSISIDDFGTGYSSLACLHRFPVNEIKLDYTFTRAAASDAASLKIAKAVVSLGHDLGRNIVAEGVEDEQTALLMREIGCDVVQGYFFGRPMPEEAYVPWLQQWAANAVHRSLWQTI